MKNVLLHTHCLVRAGRFLALRFACGGVNDQDDSPGRGSRHHLEALEPRIFFSGSPLSEEVSSTIEDLTNPFEFLVEPAGDEVSFDEWGSTVEASTSQSTKPVRLLIVDSMVADVSSIIDAMQQEFENPAQVIYLPDSADATVDLARLLASYESVDEIHLVSHGAEGQIQLGGQSIDIASLDRDASWLTELRRVMSEDGAIHLYGCNVAANEKGEAFVDRFSYLTEVVVHASSDLTGHQTWGGDWELEYYAGFAHEVSNSAYRFSQPEWNGVLAVINVTTINDTNNASTQSVDALVAAPGIDGISLREAIIAANKSAGADTIVFNLGPGLHTINLNSKLPNITDTLTIIGNGNIELNGIAAGGGADGLILKSGADGSLIGGLIINRFDENGIVLDDVNNVTLVGNRIGTDASGMVALGNGLNGILIYKGASNNLIGGNSIGNMNLISGNVQNGILIDDSNTSGNVVLGNLIGTDATGSASLGNSQSGIEIRGNATANQIGGVNAGEGNTLAFNLGDGIKVQKHSEFNTLRGNSIHSNHGLGIDLNANSITLNDPLDSDNGANGLLNFPTIDSATTFAGNTRIVGGLSSLANVAGMILDFYWSPVADGSGHGEALNYIGATTVNTDISGAATFDVIFNGMVLPSGSYVTATSTDPNGNTSELSLNRASVGSIAFSSENEVLVNQTTDDDQMTSHDTRGSHRAVAADQDGNYVVVWSSQGQDESGWGVFGRRFDKNGNPLTHEFQINGIQSDDEQHATVAMNDSGQFVVTWTANDHDGSGKGVFYRVFNASGNAITTDLQANTSFNFDQHNASIGIDGAGNFVIAWSGEGDQSGNEDNSGIFAQRFDASGAKIGAEFIVNEGLLERLGSQVSPAIAMNSAGQFAVSWNDGGGVHVQRFHSNGNPNGGRNIVDSLASVGRSALALRDDGSLVVVWQAGLLDLDVYFRRYAADGSALGVAERVASSTSGNQANPSIDVDPLGNFIVVWEGAGNQPSNGDGSGVFGQKYSTSGVRIGNEFLINQTTSGIQSQVSASFLDHGNVVAVWSGNGNQPGHEDSVGVFSRHFEFTSSVVNDLPTVQPQPTVSILEDQSLVLVANQFGFADSDGGLLSAIQIQDVTGGFLLNEGRRVEFGEVVSRAELDSGCVKFVPMENLSGTAVASIAYRVSDGIDFSQDLGSLQISILPVSDGVSINSGTYWTPNSLGALVNSSTLGAQSSSQVAALSQGGHVVVWSSRDGYLADGDDGSQYFGQLFDADGDRVNGEFLLGDAIAVGAPNIRVTALADGGFVAVWTGGSYDIYAQRYDINGSALNLDGSSATVATPTRVNKFTAGNQYDVDVAATLDGYVLTWSSRDQGVVSSDTDIVTRYIDLNGNMSNEFQVNQYDVGVQRNPRLAALNDYQFVITWINQSGDGYDISGSIIELGSDVPGLEFSINSETALRQAGQQVASLGTHGFVVVWHSENGDGSDYGIRARRFDLSGAPLDASDFVVNEVQSSGQTNPEVVGFADGSYVVLWQSPGVEGDSSYGIASRFFNASTGSWGPETVVNNPRAGHQTHVDAARLADGSVAVTWTTTAGLGSEPNFVSEIIMAKMVPAVLAMEDHFVPLDLSIQLWDHDGSEQITQISLAQLPPGSELTDGVNLVTASTLSSVNITTWDLTQLSFRPPLNSTSSVSLMLQISFADGASVQSQWLPIRVEVVGANDALLLPNRTLNTTAANSVTLSATDVANASMDPDSTAVTPLAAVPLLEYLVNSNTIEIVNSSSQRVWEELEGGQDILLAPSTQLIDIVDSAIGGLKRGFDLAGPSAGLLELTDLNSNQVAFEIWVRPDNLTQTSILLEWGTADHGLSMIQTGSTVRLAYATAGQVHGVVIPTLELLGTGLVAGEYNQIVGVIDTDGDFLGDASFADLALFVNGKLADAAVDIAVLPPLTSSSIATISGNAEAVAGIGGAIGAFASGLGTGHAESFEGQIGRLAIFNGNLTSNEVHHRFVDTENGFDVVAIDGISINGPTTIILNSGAQVQLLPDGSFEYDPFGQFNHLAPGQTATDQFTYTVVDQGGLQSTATVLINIEGNPNVLPHAVDDTISSVHSTSSTIISIPDLLDNDFDVNSDLLQVFDLGRPEQGILINNGNGTLTYTPNIGQTGSDSFDYTLTDGRQNLMHHWDLDHSAIDLIGGNSGVVTGTAIGPGGKGLWFEELDQDRVVIPDFHYGSSFSVNLEFYVDDFNGTGYRYLYSHGMVDDKIQVFIREDNEPMHTPGTLATIVQDGNDSENVHELNIDLTGMTHGWHRYTLVVEEDVGSRVYLDGTLQATSHRGADGINPTGNVFLGSRNDLSNSGFMTGGIADVSVFSTALDADQVHNLPATSTSTTGTVTIHFNAPPTAGNDSFLTRENAVLHGNVGVNDSEPNHDPLVFSLVTAPSRGSLIYQADGSFAFDPEQDFDMLAVGETATVNFVYRIVDPTGETDTAVATITIQGENDVPITDMNYVEAEFMLANNQILHGSGLLDDLRDIDGDTLRVRTTPVEQPEHGRLQLKSDGSFLYRPNRNFVGTDRFQYQVLDGQGGTLILDATIVINASAEGEQVPISVEPITDFTGIAPLPDRPAATSEATKVIEPTAEEPAPAVTNSENSQVAPTGPVKSIVDSAEGAEEIDQSHNSDISADTRNSEVEFYDGFVDEISFNAVSLFAIYDSELNKVDVNNLSEMIFHRTSGVRTLVTMNESVDWLASYYTQLDTAESDILLPMADVIPITATAAAGLLTMGYVTWMIRGGILLTTFVSSLPAWQSFDPLIVVQNSNREHETGESIEDIVDA